MHSLFYELRKLRDDVLDIVRSPAKMNSVLRIPLYSNAIYLMLASGANALLTFVFWIIAARLYSTEVVGVASAIISAASLLELLSFLGLGYGLVRFLKSSNNPIKLINSSFTVTGLLSLAVAVIFIIGLGIWSPSLHIIRENPYYLVIFLFFVPTVVLDDLTDYVIMAERQARFTLIHILLFTIIRLALLILLASSFHFFGIFISWSAATFIALLISLFLLLPKAQPGYRLFFTVDRGVLSEALHFSFLNYLGDLFWATPGLVLPIVIVNRLGAENNAYFYMAWALSNILTAIPGAVAISLLAEGAYDEEKLKNHVRRSLKIISILLTPVVVLLWFLANRFLLFYGGLYAENGTILLRWLTIAAFPLSINTIYFSIKRVQKKVKPIVLLGTSMAVIVLLMSYLLLPRLGINGVGVAWFAGQSVIALIAIVWDMRRWVFGSRHNH